LSLGFGILRSLGLSSISVYRVERKQVDTRKSFRFISIYLERLDVGITHIHMSWGVHVSVIE
jgi:hypothetical protein